MAVAVAFTTLLASRVHYSEPRLSTSHIYNVEMANLKMIHALGLHLYFTSEDLLDSAVFIICGDYSEVNPCVHDSSH